MARNKKIYPPTVFQWFSQNISWEVFQKISLHLYRIIYNDHFAEEYLLRGMFQDGIDIVSFKKGRGKSTVLQCKHCRFLTLAELKKIVDLFLVSSFLKTSDVFIVTTTANLQDPAIKKYIFEQIKVFRKDHGIEFDCWDVTRLETALKEQYLLVEHYFGPRKAEEYCFEPGFSKIVYESVPRFISRNLKDINAEPEIFPWGNSDRKVPQISIPSLFVGGTESKRHIGIIAEAYEGKSTLFRQAAYELYQYPQTAPLLLDLKGVVIQPIEKLLDIQFHTWKEIPAKNLVVLIDGLDEVASDELLETIAHIRNFGTRYPSIRIAISCRKLYFSNYNLSSELSNYKFYDLTGLNYGQIIRYADSRTLGKGQEFCREMDQKGIALLLVNPFYLTRLVGWYTDPHETIPDTRVGIALKLVEDSFATSATRKVGKGRQLAHNKVRLKKLLQQLALAFQINSVNSCDDELIQQLFSTEDTDLLKHSSILNIDKGRWMFTNAFFQEQLAATALQNYTVEEVIGLIMVGEQVRKIKTKWIQTIATYLSLFPAANPDRERLLTVIEEDNIELIAKSEGSAFLAAFKLDILKKIVGRTSGLQSRLVLIGEHELAGFIGNEKLAVNYLFETMRGKQPDITKEVCCRILRYISLTQQQVANYTAVACDQLMVTQDKYFARMLLEGLSHYRTGDRSFLNVLLSKTTLLKQHEFRQGIYKFLEAHGLVSHYYDFVLDGLEILYAYNSGISHSGSELRLMDVLLQTDEAADLKKLLKVMAGDRFHSFFKFKTDDINTLLKKLQDKLVTAYEKDQSLLGPVVDCVVTMGLKQGYDEFEGMNEFFSRTNTYLPALQLYLEKFGRERKVYAFSHHISPDCFEYLIDSCRTGLITRHELDYFISGMRYAGRIDEAEQLRTIVLQAFGKTDPVIQKSHDRYAKAEEIKAKNDIQFIESPEAFEKGVRAFFKAVGKESLTLSELHNHEDRMTKLLKVGSDLISHLMHEVSQHQTITLTDCLLFVRDKITFRIFRIKSLLTYSFNKEHQGQAIAYLRAYYLETVTSFPFAAVTNDSDFQEKKLAMQYLKIWNKYEFETPEEVLLEFIRMDGEGLNFIQTTQYSKRDSVGIHLVNYFESKGILFSFKQRVLQNLRYGIKNHRVLGTHIELCRHLHITQATPHILQAINDDFSAGHHEYGFMDIFKELGGDLGELLPIFEGIEDFISYTFIYFVKLLRREFPEEVENRLLVAFHQPGLSLEKTREIAVLLADLGNRQGYAYTINQLDPQSVSPYKIQSNWQIWNVDTAYGLELLEPLIFTLVDFALPKFRFQESVEHLVLEILRGFASKGERDLSMVLILLQKKSTEFETVYPHHYGQLLWYGQQMQEAFRKTVSDEMPVAKMKAFLARLLD